MLHAAICEINGELVKLDVLMDRLPNDQGAEGINKAELLKWTTTKLSDSLVNIVGIPDTADHHQRDLLTDNLAGMCRDLMETNEVEGKREIEALLSLTKFNLPKPNNMTQPKSLIEFKRVTHAFHAAYCMANAGMSYISSDIENMDGYNPDGRFQIGQKDETFSHRTAVAEMRNKEAVDGMRKNGPFSQIIAHGIIIWVYSLWNEEYRKKIAEELGKETNDIMCDVMGDIRILRNFIVHDYAVASQKVENLTTLNWIKEGPLVFVDEDMTKIQKAINTMRIYLKEE